MAGSDFQRQRVYRWEQKKFGKQERMEPAKAKELIAECINELVPPELNIGTPKVSFQQSRCCYHYPQRDEIRLTDWGLQAWAVAHETAHAVVGRVAKFNIMLAGHGPEFVYAYAHTYAIVTNIPEMTDNMLETAALNKLRVADGWDGWALEPRELTPLEEAEVKDLRHQIYRLIGEMDSLDVYPPLDSMATSNPERAHIGNRIRGIRNRITRLTGVPE